MSSRPPDLDFAAVLERLKAGALVARRWWHAPPGPADLYPPKYICLVRDGRVIGFWAPPSPGRQPRAHEWKPAGADLLAADWRVLSTSEAFRYEEPRR